MNLIKNFRNLTPLKLILSNPRVSRAQFLSLGFTLIELIVVVAIVGVLLTLVTPRYFKSIDRSKETVLKTNLGATRDALDKFYSDTGKFPESLADLVDKRYLRTLPFDPITDSADTWTIVAPPDGQPGAVYNVFSGASGTGSNGVPYAEW
jgi:general secretion pathway protein G